MRKIHWNGWSGSFIPKAIKNQIQACSDINVGVTCVGVEHQPNHQTSKHAAV